jgi:Cd2+/Zn2+-exporting ATPase
MKMKNSSQTRFQLPQEASLPKLVAVTFALALFLLGRFLPIEPRGALIFTAAAAIILCLDLVFSAAMKLLRRRGIDEELLFVLATAGAFALHAGKEGTAALLIYRVGVMVAAFAAAFAEMRIGVVAPEESRFVYRMENGNTVSVPLRDVKSGDVLVFHPGETVAVSGTVAEGKAKIAQSGGEGPRYVEEGDAVQEGSIVVEETLRLYARHDAAVSFSQKFSENDGAYPRRMGRMTFFSRIYAPLVLAAAVIVGVLVPLLFQQSYALWLERALGLLLTAGQNALILAVPLAYFAGITASLSRGVLFRSFGAVDTLSRTTSLVVDMATVTTGRHISHTRSDALTREQLLFLASYAYAYIEGQNAEAVLSASGEKPDVLKISDYNVLPGGVEAKIGDLEVVMGSAACMEAKGIDVTGERPAGATEYLAVNGHLAGQISFVDTLRSDAVPFVRAMAEEGVDRTVLISRADHDGCAEVAMQLGVSEFYAELAGEERLQRVRLLHSMQIKGEKMAYIARDEEDLPLFEAVDLGIAPGGAAKAVCDAVDIVLQNDHLPEIARAVSYARNIRQTAISVILLPIAVKILIGLFAILGLIPLWAVTGLDFLLTMAAILYAVLIRNRLDSRAGLLQRLRLKIKG